MHVLFVNRAGKSCVIKGFLQLVWANRYASFDFISNATEAS
jgi:hypothetical protein